MLLKNMRGETFFGNSRLTLFKQLNDIAHEKCIVFASIQRQCQLWDR